MVLLIWLLVKEGIWKTLTHPNPQYTRIKPKKKWSWGVEEPVFVQGKFNVKKAKAE
jgi:pyridoxamine 5'-phosphate oxidase family protein